MSRFRQACDNAAMPIYLALGDSMSIDDYTGVAGGGAVSQFLRTLGDEWTLDDRTCDGCQMAGVPTDGQGDLITLTIGGNDLLAGAERYLREGLAAFAAEHAQLLGRIRRRNPTAALIVGDIYAPDAPLAPEQSRRLDEANAIIAANCATAAARLAPINAAFRGHEAEYLCLAIEPTLAGATRIAQLFAEAWNIVKNPS
jgi:lysophospholipase L1-like esterase